MALVHLLKLFSPGIELCALILWWRFVFHSVTISHHAKVWNACCKKKFPIKNIWLIKILIVWRRLRFGWRVRIHLAPTDKFVVKLFIRSERKAYHLARFLSFHVQMLWLNCEPCRSAIGYAWNNNKQFQMTCRHQLCGWITWTWSGNEWIILIVLI